MNIQIPQLRSGSVSDRRHFVLLLCVALLHSMALPTLAQRRTAIRLTPSATTSPLRPAESGARERRERAAVRSGQPSRGLSALNQNQDGYTAGVPTVGEVGTQKTTAEIMSDQSAAPVFERAPRMMFERKLADRKSRPQDPDASAVASTPTMVQSQPPGKRQRGIEHVSPQEVVTSPAAPQTTSTSFTGATFADTGAFPPDAMGAVGPSQFVVFVNGRLRTFNKTTGLADTVIDANPDIFFSAVMTTATTNFTNHPQIRFDRLTRRWILTIIDVPRNSGVGIPNRILIAVSDAASAGTISGGTVWTFYFVQQNIVGVPDTNEFLDDPSLGIDNNAVYIGGNMFDIATGFLNNTAGFVIRKSSILSGGPLVTTAFRNLVPVDGPDSPRGVDNYNPAANEGYFIGLSVAAPGRLILRRISNPGTVPAISGNINIAVAATSLPIKVDHLGNAVVVDGDLDGFPDGVLDSHDRLFAAHIRNGRLWTAHNIAVTNLGAASNSNAQRRNGVRWYELVVPPIAGAPTVNQQGTIFDNAATRALARQVWMPTVMVSGQGHAAFGFSAAGTPFRANAATNGRLRTDALGTTRAVTLFTASATAYNPPSDLSLPRRWGTSSFTSLDPKDDMTMWTIQEFCDATDSYGVRVAKLLAPPPATPTTVPPASVLTGVPSVNVVITGTSVAGSEFYDPGADIAGAEPFTHISATVSGGVTVNSVTYTDPTHVTLNISTVAAAVGAKDVTITNPDGQSTTGTGVLTVIGGTAATAGQLNISEFRLRGPVFATDEFIEIYNASGAPHSVAAVTGTGYGVAASDGILRCTIPNGTVIPNRGHYLCANSTAYSLGAYAAADATYATDIADNAGIALFNSNVPVNFTVANRLDAVGSAGELNAIYKEGIGYPNLMPFSLDYSFVRDTCGKGGSNTILGTCPAGGLPLDTGNNATDFYFVDTNGTAAGAGQRLGAPGPENLASPIQRNGVISVLFLDSTTGGASAPNRVRDLTSDPGNNSTFGTLAFRRRVVNNTGAAVTRLRFRIVDFTTFPAPGGFADMRARTLLPEVVSGINDVATCLPAAAPCTVTVEGTTVDVAGGGQPNGGTYNSSLSVTLGTPLAPGASINVQFLMGLQQTGTFKFFVNIEVLP